LPEASYMGALEIYHEILNDPNLDDYVVAQVGLHDRFFFMTQILGLMSVLTKTYRPEWIYERCREVEANTDGYIDLWAREHFKAVCHETQVLTPDGWKTHGDLEPGDMVFSPVGHPVMVIATTQTFYDADCYRITFSDGEEIIASGDHLWDVNYFNRQRVPRTKNQRKGWETRCFNTRQVLRYTLHQQELRNPRYLSVDYTQPLILPEKKLPISPYVLGVWLGDGDSSTGVITNQFEQVWEELKKEGYDIGHNICPSRPDTQRRTLYGLLPQLRNLNVIDNKHIPPQYLRASLDQRIALLQGLMDSDGNVSERGDLVFVTIRKQLAEDIAELIQTLGMRANVRPYNYYKKNICRDYSFWQVAFRARPDIQPFRLQYHLDRFRPHRNKKWFGRKYIHHVEPIESVPCKCIQVVGGKYLVGRRLTATHNSTIITFAGSIQEIAKDSPIYQDLEPPDAYFRGSGQEITIGIFSHNTKIARDFVVRIKRELENNTLLPRLYPTVFWEDPKKQAPSWSRDDGLVCKRKSNPTEPTVSGWGLVDALPTSKHFKLMIYDDVVTEKSVTTPEMILKTTEAWELSDFLSARIDEKTPPRKWYIGTRYNYADTYGVMLSRKSAIPRIYPATDTGTLDGEPVLLSPEEWEKKKRDNSVRTLSCQMLQNPVAGEEQEFKPEWIRRWEIRPETLNVVICVDPASSKKKESCNSAFAVIGIDAAWNKYLLDGACHRMDLGERWRMLKYLRNKWIKQPGIQVVHVAYERYGMQADIEHYREMMRIEKNDFPIQEVSWPRDRAQGAKDDRIRRLIPDHQNWKFFYPEVAYDPTTKEFDFKPPSTKLQNDAMARGKGYLVARRIMRKDENGKLYNVVERFIKNEYLFFPATTWKDFLDAMSRIYDIELNPPQVVREQEVLPEPAPDF